MQFQLILKFLKYVKYWLPFIIGLAIGIFLTHKYDSIFYDKLQKKYNHIKVEYNKLFNEYDKLMDISNECNLKYLQLKEQIEKEKVEYNKKLKEYSEKILKIKNKYDSIKPNKDLKECEQLKQMLSDWIVLENVESVSEVISGD